MPARRLPPLPRGPGEGGWAATPPHLSSQSAWRGAGVRENCCLSTGCGRGLEAGPGVPKFSPRGHQKGVLQVNPLLRPSDKGRPHSLCL